MEEETAPIQSAAATPQNPVASPQNQQPSSQGQFNDPSVIAMVKAIGQKESSNYGTPAAYNNVGDGGASQGAYQMSQGFIENWAPKAGVKYTPGTTLTPQQQDEIAYTAVNDLGTQGDPADPSLGKLSPAQIASYWNSGDPNAYTEDDIGVNSKTGESYNVPAYTSTVEENYAKNWVLC